MSELGWSISILDLKMHRSTKKLNELCLCTFINSVCVCVCVSVRLYVVEKVVIIGHELGVSTTAVQIADTPIQLKSYVQARYFYIFVKHIQFRPDFSIMICLLVSLFAYLVFYWNKYNACGFCVFSFCYNLFCSFFSRANKFYFSFRFFLVVYL